jgi:hypothetical protein
LAQLLRSAQLTVCSWHRQHGPRGQSLIPHSLLSSSHWHGRTTLSFTHGCDSLPPHCADTRTPLGSPVRPSPSRDVASTRGPHVRVGRLRHRNSASSAVKPGGGAGISVVGSRVRNCRCGRVLYGALKLLILEPYPRPTAFRSEVVSSAPEFVNERERERREISGRCQVSGSRSSAGLAKAVRGLSRCDCGPTTLQLLAVVQAPPQIHSPPWAGSLLLQSR